MCDKFQTFATLQVDVETITEVGDPKEAICAAVGKFKISLLILGSHGRGAIKRFVTICFWS